MNNIWLQFSTEMEKKLDKNFRWIKLQIDKNGHIFAVEKRQSEVFAACTSVGKTKDLRH